MNVKPRAWGVWVVALGLSASLTGCVAFADLDGVRVQNSSSGDNNDPEALDCTTAEYSCGGDPVGRWEVLDVCFETDPFPICGGTLETTIIDFGGDIEFRDDGTMGGVLPLTVEADIRNVDPHAPSCLALFGVTRPRTCEELAKILVEKFYMSAECSGSSRCDCFAQSIMPLAPRKWKSKGNNRLEITTEEEGDGGDTRDEASDWEFCERDGHLAMETTLMEEGGGAETRIKLVFEVD